MEFGIGSRREIAFDGDCEDDVARPTERPLFVGDRVDRILETDHRARIDRSPELLATAFVTDGRRRYE